MQPEASTNADSLPSRTRYFPTLAPRVVADDRPDILPPDELSRRAEMRRRSMLRIDRAEQGEHLFQKPIERSDPLLVGACESETGTQKSSPR